MKRLLKKYLDVNCWADLIFGIFAGIGGLWLFCSLMHSILCWFGCA